MHWEHNTPNVDVLTLQHDGEQHFARNSAVTASAGYCICHRESWDLCCVPCVCMQYFFNEKFKYQSKWPCIIPFMILLMEILVSDACLLPSTERLFAMELSCGWSVLGRHSHTRGGLEDKGLYNLVPPSHEAILWLLLVAPSVIGVVIAPLSSERTLMYAYMQDCQGIATDGAYHIFSSVAVLPPSLICLVLVSLYFHLQDGRKPLPVQSTVKIDKLTYTDALNNDISSVTVSSMYPCVVLEFTCNWLIFHYLQHLKNEGVLQDRMSLLKSCNTSAQLQCCQLLKKTKRQIVHLMLKKNSECSFFSWKIQVA